MFLVGAQCRFLAGLLFHSTLRLYKKYLASSEFTAELLHLPLLTPTAARTLTSATA